MFNPENRVIRAISGSAGIYTMPEDTITYSYGLKNIKLPVSWLSFTLKILRLLLGMQIRCSLEQI